MEVDFPEIEIDLIITYRVGNEICSSTICLADIYNIKERQLVNNVRESIVEELRSAIEHAKYDIEDEGVHIIGRLERNEFSIFVTNSLGFKKTVNFSKPRELKTFCKQVMYGEINQNRRIIASFGEPPVKQTVWRGNDEYRKIVDSVMLSSVVGAPALSNQDNNQAVGSNDHDNRKRLQYTTSLYKQVLSLYHEIPEKERNLNRYIFWLKFNQEEAHKKYNEWKESLIPQFVELKVNRIMALIKPMNREELKKKINLRKLFEDIASAILVPASARPPLQVCNGKRCSKDKFDSNFYEVLDSVFLLIQGALQVGKSVIEALFAVFACEFQIACIMITNKVAFAANLKAKVKYNARNMLDEHSMHYKQFKDFADHNIFCITENDDTAVRFNDKRRGLCPQGKVSGAVLVIGDTHSQIEKATDLIKVMKQENYFFIVIDESDIVAGRNKELKVSQALRRLLALRPVAPSSTNVNIGGELRDHMAEDDNYHSKGNELIYNRFGEGGLASGAGSSFIALISASPISNIIDLMVIGAQNVKPYRIKPGLDYVGLPCFKPMQDERGKNVFLDEKELSIRSEIEGGKVPYTNKKLLQFISQAMESENRGILVAVITNCLVHVDGNINHQSRFIQDLFEEQGIQSITITQVGKSPSKGRHTPIEVRYPGGGKSVPILDSKPISQVIHEINDEFGLEMPIIAFGFSQFNRGVSIWSKDRVVTHIAVVRGTGYNMAEMYQSLGRGCFQGKHILEMNGHEHVTVLTTGSDYDMMMQVEAFFDRFFERIEKSPDSFSAITKSMQGDLEASFPEEANILRSCNRQLSSNKKHKPAFVDSISFDCAEKLFAGEDDLRKMYWHNPRVQRFMRTLIRLHEKNPRERFDARDVQNRFNAKWAPWDKIAKGKEEGVSDLLNVFTRKGKLDKETSEDADKKNPLYLVRDVQIFRMLLNPDETLLK